MSWNGSRSAVSKNAKTAKRKWSNLGWEVSDSPVFSVELADNLFRKETKLMYGTVAGDLKWLRCFHGDLWAFVERGLAVVSLALPSLKGEITRKEKRKMLLLHGNLRVSDMWRVE